MLIQHALDLIFPPRCAGCGSTGAVLCSSCIAQFKPIQPPFCRRCSSPLAPGGQCSVCRYAPLLLNGVRAVGVYEGALRHSIHALKYDGNTRLAEPLGAILAQAFLVHGLRADALVPIPLHHERQRQRGYNHASLLAQVCSAKLGIPSREDIVSRQRATPAQVGLSAQERRKNVGGAFTCAPIFATGGLRGRSIVVIDDVCTTGATLNACAEPLFAAGASAVWGLVLARPIPL